MSTSGHMAVYMDRSVTQKILYEPQASEVHIIFFGWRTGPYTAIWPFWGPYNIFLVTDRSIYCHMTFSAMNYLLYISVWIFIIIAVIMTFSYALVGNMSKRPHYQNAPTFYQNAPTLYQNAPLFSQNKSL